MLYVPVALSCVRNRLALIKDKPLSQLVQLQDPLAASHFTMLRMYVGVTATECLLSIANFAQSAVIIGFPAQTLEIRICRKILIPTFFSKLGAVVISAINVCSFTSPNKYWP